MNAKRLVVVAVAFILVASIAVLTLVPGPDNRTETERLVLTAFDLAGMNATQHSEPFPNPNHPAARDGSEAAESDLSLNADGWYLDVQCLLVLYNSSSLARQNFQGLELDDSYTEVDAGEGCFMGGQYDETFGTSQVIRMNVYAVVLQNDTITYFAFRAYPPDVPGAFPAQAVETVFKMQADKAQRLA